MALCWHRPHQLPLFIFSTSIFNSCLIKPQKFKKRKSEQNDKWFSLSGGVRARSRFRKLLSSHLRLISKEGFVMTLILFIDLIWQKMGTIAAVMSLPRALQQRGSEYMRCFEDIEVHKHQNMFWNSVIFYVNIIINLKSFIAQAVVMLYVNVM